MATKRKTPEPPDRRVKTPEAAAHIGQTRGGFWEMRRRDPSFPAPIYVGPRSPRWSLAELDDYVRRQTALRALRPAKSVGMGKGKDQ